MSDALFAVNEANWETEVLRSSTPVAVDFWAAWCGPCRALAPVLEELQIDFGDSLRFVSVNIEENMLLASKYGIRALPTVSVFVNGEQKESMVGMQPKISLRTALEKYIQKDVDKS